MWNMKKYSINGKVGACIEIKNNNYGSMLQSYATQMLLKDFGLEYEMLTYKKKYTPLFVLKSIPRVFNRVQWQDKLQAKKKKDFIKKHPEITVDVKARNKAFDGFRERYFTAPITTYYGFDALKKSSDNYVAFLTGSDQLWSPSGLPTNFYNLKFVQEDKLKISFASSFGVSRIPWYQIRRTRDYLNRIQFISCREKTGTEIVLELTGRTVPVVADPTMMYDKSKWDSMLKSEKKIEGDYIFAYFLGDDERCRKETKKLSDKTGLKIVSIRQYVDADLNFGDIHVKDADPADFVNLIKNARYVCTDSFHGSVFSIINHRQFIVFNRYSDNDKASKNTRIENLCERLGLNRRFNGDIVNEMLREIDYNLVDKKMNAIREETISYLETAFDAI